MMFRISYGEFISKITYFFGLDTSFNDMSSANVHLSMIGSHTAIKGLKNVLDRDTTVDSIDLDRVWWNKICASERVKSKTGTYASPASLIMTT